MIIRTTFKDNDFTQVLENYWNGFWFKNYYNVTRKIEDPREYRDRNVEAEDLLKKAFYEESKMTVAELRTFQNIIKESILGYVKEFYTKDYQYLKKHLDISFRFQVIDKDENGEVLYYFLRIKKFIIL